MNFISFYNEIAVSSYLYFAFMMTDFLDSQVQDDSELQQLANLRLSLSWILTCLLLFTILVNFLFFIANLAWNIFKYLKRKIRSTEKASEKYKE